MPNSRRPHVVLGAFLIAQSVLIPIGRAGEDPLRFGVGVAKQSDLLSTFSTLKQFVRNIPKNFRSCAYRLKSKAETLNLIEKDETLRKKVREIFDERLNAPTAQNCLSFANVPREFAKIMETNLGVCAGITYTAWLTNYLAIWDEAGRDHLRFKVEPKLAEGWTADRIGDAIARWRTSERKSYNQKDREALAGFFEPFFRRLYVEKRVTVVPFFKDLEEFSSHPATKDFMKHVALEKWAETNFSALSLFEMGFSGRHVVNDLRKRELTALVRQAKDYLDAGVAPIVFFSLPSHEKSLRRIHVVRIKKIVASADGDAMTLIVVDPNFIAPDNIRRITVKGLTSAAAGDRVKAVYSRYQDDEVDLATGAIAHPLAELEMVPWFDVESVEMLKAWKAFLEEFG